MDGALRREGEASVLDVWAVPGASRTELRGKHGDALRIRVAAPAAGGQANRAIERYLGDLLATQVSVVGGIRSRKKLVRIESVDLGAIASQLGIGRT